MRQYAGTEAAAAAAEQKYYSRGLHFVALQPAVLCPLYFRLAYCRLLLCAYLRLGLLIRQFTDFSRSLSLSTGLSLCPVNI